SDDLRRRGRAAGAGRACSLLRPGTPRVESGSDDCVALRIEEGREVERSRGTFSLIIVNRPQTLGNRFRADQGSLRATWSPKGRTLRTERQNRRTLHSMRFRCIPPRFPEASSRLVTISVTLRREGPPAMRR